jgi:hypothetical protein
MSNRFYWSTEEKDILKKMVSAGCDCREVMAVLKTRDDSSIRGQINRMGIKFKSEGGEIDYDSFKKILKRRGEVIECGS